MPIGIMDAYAGNMGPGKAARDVDHVSFAELQVIVWLDA